MGMHRLKKKIKIAKCVLLARACFLFFLPMNWYAQLGMSTEIPRRGMDPHRRPCREKKNPIHPHPCGRSRGSSSFHPRPHTGNLSPW